jgi:RNA polymerase sigma-70 factor (ECF subfamily)
LSLNNKKLIKALKKNDPLAWQQAVNEFSDNLYAYAMSLCSNHEMASEIVQQVFVNTYEGKHKLNPEYSLKSFLYRSAFNKFIDMYRKKKSMSALHEQYYFLLEQLTSNEIDLSDKLKLMNLKIESLPSRTKEIFCLSKQNGLSNVEISETLNISLKTVEGHITKAFKLLRNELISSKN